jgi:hypothetical protein
MSISVSLFSALTYAGVALLGQIDNRLIAFLLQFRHNAIQGLSAARMRADDRDGLASCP